MEQFGIKVTLQVIIIKQSIMLSFCRTKNLLKVQWTVIAPSLYEINSLHGLHKNDQNMCLVCPCHRSLGNNNNYYYYFFQFMIHINVVIINNT